MIKQYILIRTEVWFPVGKIMAHIGHNILEAYFNIDLKKHYHGSWLIYNTWQKEYNQTKIILDGVDIESIEKIVKQAERIGIPTSFIEDVHLKKKIVAVIGPLQEEQTKILGLNKLSLYR